MDEQNPGTPKFNPPQPGRQEPEKVPDAPLLSEVNQPKPKASKKKLLIIITALALLLLAGAAVWYFILNDDNGGTQQNQEPANQNSAEIPQYQGVPDRVAYAYRDSDVLPYTLYFRPAIGGERTEVMTLPEGSYISQSTVKGNKVALAIQAEAGGDAPSSILYSSDGGASYQKIYEAADAMDEGQLGEQVTSMVFSSDETTLLAGILGPEFAGNKVTEFQLDGLDSKVLFEAEENGIFLKGYDRQAQRILYFDGCYNCDGNLFSQLKLYDVSSGSSSVIYTSETGDLKFSISPEYSEILIADGQLDNSGDGMGVALQPPFEIKKISLSDTSQVETLETVDQQVLDVGYTQGGTPYYAGEQAVVKLGDSPGTVYETAGSISYPGVYFVGEDSVVVATGEPIDFLLDYYEQSSEAVNILAGDSNTVIFGVTIK